MFREYGHLPANSLAPPGTVLYPAPLAQTVPHGGRLADQLPLPRRDARDARQRLTRGEENVVFLKNYPPLIQLLIG